MGIGTGQPTQSSAIRILLVADTHLGLDLPLRPRVERRRRGDDFFANFQRALQPALRGEVDLVVHGGDLLDRSRVPPALAELALAPLVRVAGTGIPVYLVPGNHERSRIPLHLWSAHPNLHIFDRPRTFVYAGRQGSLALTGFPFARRIRDRLPELLQQAGLAAPPANAALLCLHQTVEGARVGPSGYTFRAGPDVIPRRAIPPGYCAVLCGHIHRRQLLARDPARPGAGPLVYPGPVIYPGSVERASFAERDEEKGYAIVTVDLAAGPPAVRVSFQPLPARSMVMLVLEPPAAGRDALLELLASRLRELDPDSVVRVKLQGPDAAAARYSLSAACLRDLAPPTMNVELAPPPSSRHPRQSPAFQV